MGAWCASGRWRPEYDPTDREAAYAYVRARQEAGEVVTGLLYLEEGAPDMHGINRTVARPLAELSHQELCPGNAALQDVAGGIPLADQRLSDPCRPGS